MTISCTPTKKPNGYYHVRVYVPISLQYRFQKKELVWSLKTKNKKKSLQCIYLLNSVFSDFFQMAKGQPQLSADQLNEIARSYFHQVTRESQHARLTRRFKKGERDHHITHLIETRERLKDWAARNRLSQISEEVDQLLRDEGIDLPKDSIEYLSLSRDCLEALLCVNQASLDWYSGQSDENVFLFSLNQTTPATPQPQASKETLCSLLPTFLKSKQVGWSERTHEKYSANLEVCSAILGEGTPVTSVEKRQIREVRDTLSKLPSNWIKTHPDKTPSEVAQLDHPEEILLSPSSVNAYLTALSSFFSWCIKEGYASVNPVSGIRATEIRNASEKRIPYTIKDLNLLFAGPTYSGQETEKKWNKPGNIVLRDDRFWLPFVALFSGMRLGEMVSLKRDHFVEANGIPFFNIIRAKTKAGERQIPIHNELIKIGLVQHIKTIEPKGYIFPQFSQKAFSKFFKRFQLNVGINDPRLVFHSFRHTFTDGLRSARVEEPIMKSLLGHADGSVTGIYGSGYPLNVLRDAINSITYHGLEIRHVYSGEKSQ